MSSLAPWELAPRLPRSLRYIFVLSSPQPAPWQPAPWLPGSLASYRRTAVSAGSAGAGSLAPCELTLRLRAVVVAAGSVAAGSLAPWELTSYLHSRLRGSRLPGSLRAYVASANCLRSRLRGSRLPGSLGAFVISSYRRRGSRLPGSL